jgi:predicted transglutaminase-like cysteine proteinase
VTRLVVIMAVALLATGCSQTGGTATMMTTRGYAFAPPAFYSFCTKQPGLCSTQGKSKVVTLTAARKAQLKHANESVNRRIKERKDAGAGRSDDWRLPMSEGDCEDFAILKKAELLKQGWPASALLLTVATLGGEGHTVLTARTNQGDLILDNRTNAIKDWSRTPYRYFARQSQFGGGRWTRIGSAVPIS